MWGGTVRWLGSIIGPGLLSDSLRFGRAAAPDKERYHQCQGAKVIQSQPPIVHAHGRWSRPPTCRKELCVEDCGRAVQRKPAERSRGNRARVCTNHHPWRDKRVGGGVQASIEVTLVERDEDKSELSVKTDVQFIGRLGDLGQPLIKRKADSTIQKVAENLRLAVSSGRHQT